MKENRLLSVIVPAYNAEKTIRECLNSIRSQKYIDIEIIVVDDGSTDLTANICLDLAQKDSRINYFYQENKGVSAARNKGIDNSKGRFITFVDADDAIFENIYLKMIPYLEENEVVTCSYLINGKSVKVKRKEGSDFATFVICEEVVFGYVWNKIFHRKIIDEFDIRFDEKIHLSEDMLFCLQYSKYVNKFRLIEDDLYNYRISEIGAMYSEITMKKLSVIEAHEIAERYISKRLKLTVRNQMYIVLLAMMRQLVKADKSKSEIYGYINTKIAPDYLRFFLDSRIKLKFKFALLIYKIDPMLFKWI